jgi:hypothetical protein
LPFWGRHHLLTRQKAWSPEAPYRLSADAFNHSVRAAERVVDSQGPTWVDSALSSGGRQNFQGDGLSELSVRVDREQCVGDGLFEGSPAFAE